MDFCTRLANQLMLNEVGKSIEGNIVVSPVSMEAVLNMVTAGSKGRALEQMLGFLGSKNIEEINSKSSKMMAVATDVGSSNNAENGPILAMVNGAWSDQHFPLKPKYRDNVLEGIFNCEAKTVDFATQAEKLRDEINAWAEAASRGLIKDFLEPGSPSPDTALVLANGLYFKGTWDYKYKFDANRTKTRDFYLLNGGTVSVPFMTSRKTYYGQSFDGFKVLEIPYENGELKRHFYMYFFLPDERHGLQDLLEKLISSPGMHFNLSKVKLEEFWIPRFKFSYGFDVTRTMEGMGIPPFMKNSTDFSEMLHIPEGIPFDPSIIQKAFIEVNEKGTEAAAITALDLMGCSMYEPEKLNFVADHPFVFMIKESTSKLVFFTGAVLDPSQSK